LFKLLRFATQNKLATPALELELVVASTRVDWVRLWVDVLKGGREVLHAFKPYLESETILKVRQAHGTRVRPPCG
jgi:hypothetical protein